MKAATDIVSLMVVNQLSFLVRGLMVKSRVVRTILLISGLKKKKSGVDDLVG